MKRIVFSGILGLISFTSQAQDQTVNGHLTVENQLTVNSISKFLNTSYWGGNASTSFGLTTWGAGFGGLGFGTNAGKGDLIFFTDFANQQPQKRMVIQQTTGNVGIGTTAPQEKLHINGSIRGADDLGGALKISTLSGWVDIGPKNGDFCHFNTNSSVFYFDKPVMSNPGSFASYSNNDLKLQTGIFNTSQAVTRLIIQNGTGYVGIGTETPEARLHALANYNGFASVIENQFNYGAGLLIKAGSGAASTSGAYYVLKAQDNNNKDLFHINGYTGTVYASSNVGIGTTAPTSKLEIKASDNNSSLFSIKDNAGGDILKVRGQDRTMYVRSLEVTLLNFPDYVFEKNYPLMPLKEVESYIQANKHLPNIPSAKEIEENGANLGDLVKLQMEKIEELTLYLIELQKASEATNKENVEIKKQLEELKMK